LLAVVIALVTVWASIACSYTTNWPVGFYVSTFSALAYGVGRVSVIRRRRLARRV
jgi:zinc/manganese transport system permease protein